MATIEISASDLRKADTFLTAYLKDKIPDADFSEGTAVRDFTVKAVAYIFAFLEKERQATRDRQSLLTLSNLPADESVDDAVDALLSNWFITRKDGKQTRITSTLHFSKAVDLQILPTTKFYRTTSLVFYPAQTSTIVIPASDLKPTVAADGTIIDYTVDLSLIAQTVGTSFNVTPGRFVAVDPFSPFFLYAENRTEGSDGRDVETTSELLERAPTAITVRNLINSRSIDTVLKELFTNVTRILSVGFGEPEMIRDRSDEAVTGLKMHVGGHNDIYVSLPRTEVTETLEIGGLFARPDNLINILRDSTIAFNALVEPGHVLRVTAGIPDAPREFIVVRTDIDELEVHPRTPFAVATDENAEFGAITYSVGKIAPDFSYPVAPRTTGVTSRKTQTSGRVTLTGQPHYKVKRVEVIDGTEVTELSPRVNGVPGSGQYQVVVRVPAYAQSAKSVTEVVVPGEYDGLDLRVTYETLVGYGDVQNYVTDRFERVLGANPLVKAFNPVYLTMVIPYRVKNNATTIPSAAAMAAAVNTYVNAFDATNNIDVSSITGELRTLFPDAQLSPFKINYTLIAPDGQLYEFETTDVVTISPTLENGACLVNGADLRTPIQFANLDATVAENLPLITKANAELSAQLLDTGVSDRTIQYISQLADISVVP